MNTFESFGNGLCPLCKSRSSPFYQRNQSIFFRCSECNGIFRPVEFRLNREDEKNRYLLHQYSNTDQGYLNFVKPITDHVLSNIDITKLGLDYGCGHIPVLSNYLSNLGFKIRNYDPIFFDQQKHLERKYHFIICCEVMEHFYEPDKEFKKLFDLLEKGGALISMTHLFEEHMDFDQWYYKNDHTHVFIYSSETIEWIAHKYHFTSFRINKRLILFKK